MRAGSFKYGIIESIMESPFFYGLSQIDSIDNCKIIGLCCLSDCYEYLSLILKYSYKNELCIINGINFVELFGQAPLIQLLESQHCTDEWINLILFEILNKISIKKCKIKNKTLTIAKFICRNKLLNSKWEDLINQYCDALNNQQPDTPTDHD